MTFYKNGKLLLAPTIQRGIPIPPERKQLSSNFYATAKAMEVGGCIDTSMPDCYIDRWDAPVRGQYQAVYCRAYVPSNCPHPSERFPTTTTWRTRSVAAVAMMNGN